MLLVGSLLFAAVMQNPSNCVQKQIYPCQLLNEQSNLESVKKETYKFYVAKGVLLEWESASELNLLSGKLFVEGNLKLISPFLKVISKSDAAFLVEVKDDKIQIHNYGSNLEIEFWGGESYTLVKGLSEVFFRVDPVSGKNKREVATRSELASLQDFFGKDHEWLRQNADLLLTWDKELRELNFKLSSSYQDHARKLAEDQASRLEEKRRAKLLRQQEDAEIRKFYRQKNYLSP